MKISVGTTASTVSSAQTGISRYSVCRIDSAAIVSFPPMNEQSGRITVTSMMFAPRMLPTDIDVCFFTIAVIAVTSSGSDVPIATIVTAIGNHDEGNGVPVNEVAAALILADKADVRRSRVRNTDTTTFDIHDRVNYSVKKSQLKINEDRTLVKLKLTVDTKYGSVMDYFEIFMQRMILCRKAAERLGLQFKLMINEQQLI